MATPKLLELPSGAAAGSVPTVQADGTVVYAVPTVASTIDDTTTSPSKTWSSTKTAAAIAAVPGAAAATTTAEGVVQLAGDLAGTAAAPTLAALSPSPAGTFGSASAIPVVTVDGKGRVTAASTVAPAFGFVFYDPTTGWPAATGVRVFYSVGFPSAPAPTGGSNDSVWFFSPS